jgi:16S rRNA (cytidine1402-2'-O)-methyltransferase
MMSSQLFIVATPIGNLGDITLRAIETLKTVDIVACEDTRRTEKLLSHLGFHKPLLRYDEHTHVVSSQRILAALRTGKSVALVTDAGTPAVSDPGARLVSEAIKAGIKIAFQEASLWQSLKQRCGSYAYLWFWALAPISGRKRPRNMKGTRV